MTTSVLTRIFHRLSLSVISAVKYNSNHELKFRYKLSHAL